MCSGPRAPRRKPPCHSGASPSSTSSRPPHRPPRARAPKRPGKGGRHSGCLSGRPTTSQIPARRKRPPRPHHTKTVAAACASQSAPACPRGRSVRTPTPPRRSKVPTPSAKPSSKLTTCREVPTSTGCRRRAHNRRARRSRRPRPRPRGLRARSPSALRGRRARTNRRQAPSGPNSSTSRCHLPAQTARSGAAPSKSLRLSAPACPRPRHPVA
mmetsp:Transcript_25955/g.74282  ORF Transcript_25955/g.74282 Transcript_25955/m.74282 type:complete len:213 (-) Transcript_25955:95-733(-)